MIYGNVWLSTQPALLVAPPFHHENCSPKMSENRWCFFSLNVPLPVKLATQDFVPSSERGRWNAAESISSMSWSGSAVIGGTSKTSGVLWQCLGCMIGGSIGKIADILMCRVAELPYTSFPGYLMDAYDYRQTFVITACIYLVAALMRTGWGLEQLGVGPCCVPSFIH